MNQEWRIFRGAALVAIGSRGLIALLGFGIGILLARNVPQAELGVYFLLVQSAVVLGFIYDCGTSGANQRFVSIAAERQAWHQIRRLLRYTVRTAGTSFLLSTIALLLVWRFVAAALDAPELEPLVWALIGLALGRALEEFGSCYFRSIGRPRIGVMLLGVPRQITMFIGLAAYLALRGGLDLESASYWRTGSTLGAALLGVAYVAWHLRRHRQREPWEAPTYGEYRGVATTVLAHLLAAYLFAHQDLWFLGIFLTKADVGLYGVMLQLVTLIAAMMAVVNLILPPMVSKMYDAGRRAEVEALMRRIATLSGWFALVLLVVLALWGDALIGFFYGEQYVAGHTILIILAVGHAFNVGVGSPGYLLQMTGHHRTLLKITVSSLILNGMLNYVGVHTLGPVGVALATAITVIVQNCLLLLFARRRTGIRTYAFLNPLTALRGSIEA